MTPLVSSPALICVWEEGEGGREGGEERFVSGKVCKQHEWCVLREVDLHPLPAGSQAAAE